MASKQHVINDFGWTLFFGSFFISNVVLAFRVFETSATVLNEHYFCTNPSSFLRNGTNPHDPQRSFLQVVTRYWFIPGSVLGMSFLFGSLAWCILRGFNGIHFKVAFFVVLCASLGGGVCIILYRLPFKDTLPSNVTAIPFWLASSMCLFALCAARNKLGFAVSVLRESCHTLAEVSGIIKAATLIMLIYFTFAGGTAYFIFLSVSVRACSEVAPIELVVDIVFFVLLFIWGTGLALSLRSCSIALCVSEWFFSPEGAEPPGTSFCLRCVWSSVSVCLGPCCFKSFVDIFRSVVFMQDIMINILVGLFLSSNRPQFGRMLFYLRCAPVWNSAMPMVIVAMDQLSYRTACEAAPRLLQEAGLLSFCLFTPPILNSILGVLGHASAVSVVSFFPRTISIVVAFLISLGADVWADFVVEDYQSVQVEMFFTFFGIAIVVQTSFLEVALFLRAALSQNLQMLQQVVCVEYICFALDKLRYSTERNEFMEDTVLGQKLHDQALRQKSSRPASPRTTNALLMSHRGSSRKLPGMPKVFTPECKSPFQNPLLEDIVSATEASAFQVERIPSKPLLVFSTTV